MKSCATCIHVRKTYLDNPVEMDPREWHCRRPNPENPLSLVTGEVLPLERRCTEERAADYIYGHCGWIGAHHVEGPPIWYSGPKMEPVYETLADGTRMRTGEKPVAT